MIQDAGCRMQDERVASYELRVEKPQRKSRKGLQSTVDSPRIKRQKKENKKQECVIPLINK